MDGLLWKSQASKLKPFTSRFHYKVHTTCSRIVTQHGSSMAQGSHDSGEEHTPEQLWPTPEEPKSEPTLNSCEEVGANWWWWHWKWVSGSAKKHLPSSGCSHKHAVAQHRHTSGGHLKHTSPDDLLYWHTQHKLHLQTALPSSTLLDKPIWMGTPPSSATCSTWLRNPRPIPASP